MEETNSDSSLLIHPNAWQDDSLMQSPGDSMNTSQTSLQSLPTPYSLIQKSSASTRPKSAYPLFGRHKKVAPVAEGELGTAAYSSATRLKSPDFWAKEDRLDHDNTPVHPPPEPSTPSTSSKHGRRTPTPIARPWQNRVSHSSQLEDNQANCEARPMTPDSVSFVGDSYKEEEERASLVVSIEKATGEKVVEDELSPRQSLGDGEDSSVQSMVSLQSHSKNGIEVSPFIPFHCAKNALAMVVSDMQQMKARHVDIVGRIQYAYSDIQQESQVQYRGFVQNMKEQHRSKVTVYKQLVKVLQEEMDNMKQYWEGTAMSLGSRNKELLEENQTLYQRIRDTYEKMQAKQEKTTDYFTKRLDSERTKHNREMHNAKETLHEFHAKCKNRIKVTETNSSEQLSKERASYNQTLQALEKELTENREKLQEVSMTYQLQQKEMEEFKRKRNSAEKVDSAASTGAVTMSEKEETQRKSNVSVDHVATTDTETETLQEDECQSLETEGNASPTSTPQRAEKQSLVALDQKPRHDPVLDHKQVDVVSLDMSSSTKTSLHCMELEGEGNDGSENPLTQSATEESELSDENGVVDVAENVQHTVGENQVGEEMNDELNRDGSGVIQVDEEENEPCDEDKMQQVEVDEMNNEDGANETEETKVVGEEQERGDEEVTEGRESPSPTKLGTGKKEASQKSQQRTKQAQVSDPKLQQQYTKLKEQVTELKKQHQTDLAKAKTMEKELVKAKGNGTASVEDKKELKKKEKELKDLLKQNESAKNNLGKIQSQLTTTETTLTSLKKDHEKLIQEAKLKESELQKLSVAARDGASAIEKVNTLQEEAAEQALEVKKLSESFNSERILRKKYYNIIEDMKGKIRVYCRVRPLSKSEKERNDQCVAESPDEYSMHIRGARGTKEFQFDQVFTSEHSQDGIFEDTKNLIQSAVDGYNVCIFAYGQTGSGKTYTMIGGKDSRGALTSPGIAPKAFEEVFHLLDANRGKFTFAVSCYMMELYNDKLIDLFHSKGKEPARLDIKKDKKGMVVVNGALTHGAESAAQLMELFELGSKSRHTSSTKMNAESSRSHLVIGIVIESTNLTNGTVHRGKLSIVDLAGSERASKTGATPEQLKEAQSINKSLSALGDVISALSSGQDFVPYRNNKLTLLMQDSLGGNAKTLMFVNISPADYNAEETITSLTYAARVKLITNDASKNADNKEIARLKGIIAKLKSGETIADNDD